MSPTDTPIRLPIPPVPRGFRMGAVHAGIKRNATREDVMLVVSDLPATAAGIRVVPAALGDASCAAGAAVLGARLITG